MFRRPLATTVTGMPSLQARLYATRAFAVDVVQGPAARDSHLRPIESVALSAVSLSFLPFDVIPVFE